MLVWLVTVLSFIIGVGIQYGTSGKWWILPLSFCAAWIVLGILAFLFLWIMCQRVDKEKPAQDSPLYRNMLRLYVDAAAFLCQIKYDKTGFDKLPQSGRYLLVANHLDNADPLVLHHCFPKSHLAFISKRENMDMFIIGSMMHMTLCQMINRENDREALKTILSCISILKEDRANIAVFPEGYTSDDGLLRPFRSGVFKIAQKANVPIVVVTLKDTNKIFTNAKHLRSTLVGVHLVDVIYPEDFAGKTAIDIGNHVHTLMATDLGPNLVFSEENS